MVLDGRIKRSDVGLPRLYNKLFFHCVIASLNRYPTRRYHEAVCCSLLSLPVLSDFGRTAKHSTKNYKKESVQQREHAYNFLHINTTLQDMQTWKIWSTQSILNNFNKYLREFLICTCCNQFTITAIILRRSVWYIKSTQVHQTFLLIEWIPFSSQ